MQLEAGSRLGPYEVLGPIGAGGMGEVYRARDTRLERVVALKTLPSSLASDPMLRVRFEREAKAISALNHPNICALYDVGRERGIDYLVMEHLEGETLEERIRRGPLPPAEVIRYGIEIAAALENAHRQGVVHRDLKPSNIALTRSGAKLLDFGLARTVEGEAAIVDVSGATVRQPLTGEGTIVGTFQYMAPEQIEGRPADARTDLFAFGAVLYEMLTGRRAFDGKSRASVIAAILATEPPAIREIQPVTPPALDRLIRICLAKDPDERWQTAHDVRLELEGIREMAWSVATGSGGRVGRREALAWSALALLAAGGAVAVGLHLRNAHVPPPPRYLHLMPPEGARYVPPDAPATISPDGRRLAFGLRTTREDRDRLWIRALDSPASRPLPGTEGAFDPFWSPDGAQLGFFADGKLKRMDPNGGPAVTIASANDPRGASWVDAETILLTPAANGPIVRISPAGGEPLPVTRLDTSRGEVGHWRPHALPDGRHFLYLAVSTDLDRSGVYVASIDGKVNRRVLEVAVAAIYAHPGYLLYYHDGSLLAQRFDPETMEVAGAPIRVTDDAVYEFQWASAGFSASRNGMLVWHARGVDAESRIVALSRDGKPVEIAEAFGVNLDLAPDDARIAVMRTDASAQQPDLWVVDLRRGVSSRITSAPQPEVGPVWSPDGRRIAFVRIEEGGSTILSAWASGAEGEERILREERLMLEPIDWSTDGRWLLVETFSNQRTDLAVVDLEAEPRRLDTFLASQFAEHSGRFSPDGRWIAYQSDETGRFEIYLQSFPPDGRKLQVSVGGGEAPRWRGDGRELFFLSRDRTVMGVELSLEGDLRASDPKPLAKLASTDWVVTGPGDRFLAAEAETPYPQPLVVVTDWAPR